MKRAFLIAALLAALPLPAAAQQAPSAPPPVLSNGFGRAWTAPPRDQDGPLQTLAITITKAGKPYWAGIVSAYLNGRGEQISLRSNHATCAVEIIVTGDGGGAGGFSPALYDTFSLHLSASANGPSQPTYHVNFSAMWHAPSAPADNDCGPDKWDTNQISWHSNFALPDAAPVTRAAPYGFAFTISRASK